MAELSVLEETGGGLLYIFFTAETRRRRVKTSGVSFVFLSASASLWLHKIYFLPQTATLALPFARPAVSYQNSILFK